MASTKVPATSSFFITVFPWGSLLVRRPPTMNRLLIGAEQTVGHEGVGDRRFKQILTPNNEKEHACFELRSFEIATMYSKFRYTGIAWIYASRPMPGSVTVEPRSEECGPMSSWSNGLIIAATLVTISARLLTRVHR